MTEDDKELLRLAAEAAGYKFPCRDGDFCMEGLWIDGRRTPDNDKFWNPLAKDGDALRLAIDAGLCIWIINGQMAVGRYFSDKQKLDGASEDVAGKREVERHALFRLAIVKAAAEIGRKKA